MIIIKFDLKLICREPLGTLHYLEWRFDCVNLKRGILERIAPAPPLNGGGRGRTCISSLQASLRDQLLLFLVPFVTYHCLLSATEARKQGRHRRTRPSLQLHGLTPAASVPPRCLCLCPHAISCMHGSCST